MTPPLQLERASARRFLATRHLLAPPRSLPPDPASVLRVVDRLGSLQFDPLEVTGRNHDLVLAARIAGYTRAWTDAFLYTTRDLYETYNKGLSIVPTVELPWYRIAWDQRRLDHDGAAFDEHAPLVAELLDRIRRDGPLASTDFEPRAAIDWYWRPTNQIRAILEALAEARGDRDLLRSLYGFDYVWEVYIPAVRRRWGYYVLPIHLGDRFVGRIEPRFDRRAGTLRVLDLWWEAGFEPLAETGFVEALTDALQAHARFGDVGRIVLPRTARHRLLAAAVRARLGTGGRVRG